jgi:hypothetical protein
LKSEVAAGGVGEFGVGLDGIGFTVVGSFPCGVGGVGNTSRPFDEPRSFRAEAVVLVDVPGPHPAVVLTSIPCAELTLGIPERDVVPDDVPHNLVVVAVTVDVDAVGIAPVDGVVVDQVVLCGISIRSIMPRDLDPRRVGVGVTIPDDIPVNLRVVLEFDEDADVVVVLAVIVANGVGGEWVMLRVTVEPDPSPAIPGVCVVAVRVGIVLFNEHPLPDVDLDPSRVDVVGTVHLKDAIVVDDVATDGTVR